MGGLVKQGDLSFSSLSRDETLFTVLDRTPTGTYVTSTTTGEAVRAFVPDPLPPPIELTPADYHLMEKANRALGRLDGITTVLPDPDLFIYLYVRKEALLSSQIEGTQSSLSDLLLFESEEAPGVPLHDVREVSNYVRALYYGLDRLQNGFPLSLRLIREIHALLLEGGRGADKRPGAFRQSQNWLGGTRPGNAHFVPPPPDRLAETLHDLEVFLHDESMPSLLKAALVHVQFETIHPFLDGNGRMGRLLITYLLCAEGVLANPILYLSLYFKTYREEYYGLLQRVRTEGAWGDWLRFFLEGVQAVSKQAVDAARDILALFADHRRMIEAECGRATGSVLRVHDALQRRPLMTTTLGVERTGLTRPTVIAALERLAELSIVSETTGQDRNRLYVYDAYMKILSQGTEPLPR